MSSPGWSVDPAAGAPPVPCRQCGAPVPRPDLRYSPWCEECGWNLDPAAPQPAHGRLARRRAARQDALVRQAFLLAERDGPAPDRRLHLFTLLASAPVHLLTLGLLTLAGLLALSPGNPVGRAVLVLLILLTLVAVLPRPARLQPGAEVLTPDRAPAAFTVVREVAQALGARAPDLILVDHEFNAGWGVFGWRRRRVLRIGLALWNLLSPGERTALLGHELGHEVNQDIRRTFLVRSAVGTLIGWATVLHPGSTRVRDTGDSVSGMVALAELIAQWLLSGVALLLAWLGEALDRTALRAGQAAEYRADLASVRVAGREPALSLLSTVLLHRHAALALKTAANRHDPDPWAAQREAVAAIPERERRRVERAAREQLHRVDVAHPPTPYRIDLVRAGPDPDPAVRPDPDLLARMDDELFAVRRRPS